MGEWLERNLLVIEERSPQAAALLRGLKGSPGVAVDASQSGLPVLVRDGRPMHSRRDPVLTASRQAATAPAGRVAVCGLGSGYFLEALRQRGVDVPVLLDGDLAAVRAALEARDLAAALAGVRLVVGDALHDPVELAIARRLAPAAVGHGPVLQLQPELAALVARWQDLKVAGRRPRVLVAGPIYGGSLGVARSVTRALGQLGVEARLFDASVFDGAHSYLRNGTLSDASRDHLLTRLCELASDTLAHEALAWKPDLFFALAQAALTRETLERFRDAQVPTAFWFVENGRVLTYWKQVASRYDHFYAIQPGVFLEQLADAGAPRPRYLPMACEPALHRPVTLTAEERARYSSDVSFAGARYVNRDRLLAALLDFNVKLWGPDWTGPVFGPHAGAPGHRFSPEESIRIFAASTINLNLHSANHVQGLDPQPDYVNPRTFELAACAAFQLVDARDPLPQLFEPDEVVTFRSLRDLRSLIQDYLARDEERQAIAARARQRAVRDHTYLHRVGQVLRDTLPPSLVAAALDEARPESIVDATARLEAASPTLTPEEALTWVVRAIYET